MVEFQCVAASIERSAEQWFSSGSLVEPILASSSVPGLFPPVEIGGEHYIDGGIVNSIPVRRAFDLGATTIYVLQVGRIERKLTVPASALGGGAGGARGGAPAPLLRQTWRRCPPGVVAHVLPDRGGATPRGSACGK